MKISEIITDKYKLRIPPTVYYELLADVQEVEAISKADYENRLKADMVAMLTDIQLEIEELDTSNNGSAYMDCAEIIQQKIDALKAESEPQKSEVNNE